MAARGTLDHTRMRRFGAVVPNGGTALPPTGVDPTQAFLEDQKQAEDRFALPEPGAGATPITPPTATPTGAWYQNPQMVEQVRHQWMTNSQNAMQVGISPQVLNDAAMFDKWAKLQQEYVKQATAGLDMSNPAAYEQAIQQAGQRLSADLIAGNVDPNLMAAAGIPQPTPVEGAGAPGGAVGAVAEPPPGATTEPPPVTTEPPPVDTTPPPDTTQPPAPPTWDTSAAGGMGWSENNTAAQDYNKWTERLDKFNELAAVDDGGAQLTQYLESLGYTIRDDNGLKVMDENGRWVPISDIKNNLIMDQARAATQAAESQNQINFFDTVNEYASQTQYDTTDIVQAFGPEADQWREQLESVFGEMAGMADTSDYIKSFMDMFPLTDFTAEALPGTTDHERMTAWFDKLKEQGIDISDPEKFKTDEGQEQFLNELRNMALRLDPENFFTLDDAAYQKIKDTELGNLINMIERKGTMSEAEISRAVNRMTAPAEREATRELERRLSAHAAAGRGYSGAVARTTADMGKAIFEMKLGKTSELFMQSIHDAEAGRISAIQQLGQIREGDLDAMLRKAELQGTLAGDILTHMSDIGKLELGRKQTDVAVWEALGNQRLKVAELELSGKLELAGLDVEQYRADVGYDTQRMQTDLERAYREQGLKLEEARFKAQQTVNQWDAAATMASIAQRGDMERLTKMADLAIKAQRNDLDAWAEFQQLSLEEKLRQRGMDQNMIGIAADLMMQIHLQQKGFDFEEWKTKYLAEHQKELKRMNIDADEAGFWDYFGGIAELGIKGAGIAFGGPAAAGATTPTPV